MTNVQTLDPDAAILRRLARGPRPSREAALRQLMDRHAGRLHGVAARMLSDAVLAEDVVQETFLKAWDHAATWTPGPARFGTWLGRVTVNACLDRLRKTRPLTGVELPERADIAPLADQLMMTVERRSAMETALKAAMTDLPERQSAALSLNLAGTSQADAAAILEITEGAYESLLVRARRSLRETLTTLNTGEMTHAV